jgi:hypothetical protein
VSEAARRASRRSQERHEIEGEKAKLLSENPFEAGSREKKRRDVYAGWDDA